MFTPQNSREQTTATHLPIDRTRDDLPSRLVHEVVLAMKHRLPVTSLGGLIHIYPTFTQVNQRAGLEAMRAKLTPLAKRVLAYYFSWWH